MYLAVVLALLVGVALGGIAMHALIARGVNGRGGNDAESRLHRRFAQYRIRGEWYRLEGKLAEYVKKLGKPKKPMR